jgi:hypothetical protein
MSGRIDPKSTLPWRVGKHSSTVISNSPTVVSPDTGHSDTSHYGGYLIAESLPPGFADFIVQIANKHLDAKHH